MRNASAFCVALVVVALSCSGQTSLQKEIDGRYKTVLGLMKRHPDVLKFASTDSKQDSISFLVSDQLVCPGLGGFAGKVLMWAYPDRTDIRALRDSIVQTGVDVESEGGCTEGTLTALTHLSTTSDPLYTVLLTPLETRFLPDKTLLVAMILRNAERKTEVEEITTSYLKFIVVFNQDNDVEKVFTYTGDY